MQALSNSQSADLMRQLNPSRLRFAAFSDRNPAMQPVKALADAVRADRKPVSADNPLHVMEQVASTWITTCWESYRLARDAMTEAMFLGTYGSPVLQAMVGQATPEAPTQRRIERDLAREAIAARSQADLEKRFEVGGLAEAVIRAIMHVRLPERTVDERGFAVLQAIRRLQPANRRRSLGEIKAMFREQYLLLRLDEERALRAIPRLLPDDAQQRAAGWKAVQDILGASGACLPKAVAGCSGSRSCSPSRTNLHEGRLACLRSPPAAVRHEKYERLIKVAAKHPPMATAVAHPCDAASLEGAVEAARMGLLQPILVGPPARIREVAAKASLDIGAFELVEAQHSHDSAAKAVELVRAGRAEALMKGSLHTDELMGAVVARDTGIRTARRISHCFVMDVPGHSQALIISDAAVNIAPTLEVKVDIVQNAIDLARALSTEPVRVAILSAMETVNPRVPSTLEAAALCKMADRGQITGGILDGPLALDNAISTDAAAIKHIVSPVAGQANVLIVPDLEAGNMLAKSLSFLAGADAAGIVLGARVPIILTSRANSQLTRLASCAVGVLVAAARRASAAAAIP